MNFAKFLRTPFFFKEHIWWLLLILVDKLNVNFQLFTCTTINTFQNLKIIYVNAFLEAVGVDCQGNQHYTIQKANSINYFNYSFISESTRWLLTHGKYEEIRIILKKLAKRNGREEPDLTILDQVIANELAIRQKQKKHTYLSLLKFKSTRLKIPLFSFMW